MNALSSGPPAVRTTCPYCGVGCGILASPDGRSGAAIAGDPSHPANRGRLCSKGTALGETLSLDGRLLNPKVRDATGALTDIDWPTALDAVAGGLRRVIDRHGPDAVAFYLSGQLLTEDYYVANKLMKGFIGSANVDTNSRLCMASAVAGHRRAFGADTVPALYADLDEAGLIVLAGSNAAWCHPVLFQRMTANQRERGAKIVVIDPRRTATAEEADLFLPLAPGTDTALFCGLLVHLARTSALDRAYIDAHTRGFENALARAQAIAPDVAATATATGLAPDDVAQFFELFVATERVVTAFSQGVNQSAQGTDKVNAIINCHLATGRIGKPGMGPFSLTGQPNAMGGREVGGLANQLAAHMGFSPAETERVRRFWNAATMATREGLKAVDMFEAIAQGRIKALWVMATNPAVSLPRAGAVREALGKLDLFVVSENVLSNDTVNAGAHVLLPAAAWGEKDGTVTNSERCISRQRAFLPPPEQTRPDWWIVTEVARRMGHGAAFAYRTAADIFREHAALSAFENDGARAFDIGALRTLDDEAYDALDPLHWPQPTDSRAPAQRFFADGEFFISDRKATFIAPQPPTLSEATTERFPLRLNTGRTRDQWHTMTRTGKSPRLGAHAQEPCVNVHPDDAARYGLADGGFACVTSRYGRATFRVRVSESQQRGSLFAPIHWSGETASAARTGDLVAPFTDPLSGQLEAKATAVAIAPRAFGCEGFVVTRRPLSLPRDTWWARVMIEGGVGYLFANDEGTDFWRAVVRERAAAKAQLSEFSDAAGAIYRAALFADGALDLCLFAAPAGHAPYWDTVKAAFAAPSLSDAARRTLLSGKAADSAADHGPTVCACFGVGLTAIRDAIAAGAKSTADIGQALRAGTNCGSCIPELKKLLSPQLSQTAHSHERTASAA
ncbi:MAG: molybdopterin-dependent oxidoreductase [Pseudorhodoplanes sp.]|nr:molybdopterin-dependent oxidoreductase [Pseudorhodoplanes sp.]